MSGYQENEDKGLKQESAVPDMAPIEPEGGKLGKPNILKWVFFGFVIIYILLSYYYAPILTHFGRYLILEHPPERSDLIVCLAGGNIERGLATVDAYQEGLAPQIFVTREALPDGYDLLKEKGLSYPESIDLLMTIFEGLGVPESAVLIGDKRVRSTFDEAKVVRDLAGKRGYRSLILITSPTHTRRAWLTFRKVFEDRETRILVIPSRYSKFRPEDWWKDRRHVKEVVIEYEKLIYYALKYFI